MTDPMTPIGSPGQLPQALSGSPPPPTRAVEAAVSQSSSQASAPAASAPGVAEDAVLLELSRKAAARASQEDRADKGELSLEEAAKSLRDYIAKLPSDLQFNLDKESGIVVFKVVNPVTREVIRQFPPDEIVEMARHIKAMSLSPKKSGLLIDKQL